MGIVYSISPGSRSYRPMDVLHKLQLEAEALPVVGSVDIREQALLFHNESSGS